MSGGVNCRRARTRYGRRNALVHVGRPTVSSAPASTTPMIGTMFPNAGQCCYWRQGSNYCQWVIPDLINTIHRYVEYGAAVDCANDYRLLGDLVGSRACAGAAQHNLRIWANRQSLRFGALTVVNSEVLLNVHVIGVNHQHGTGG